MVPRFLLISFRAGSILQAVQDKNFCCSYVNGKVQLKQDHAYYYQVQTQMFLPNRDYCDFVVWTPHGLSVERIYPDQEFWESVVPKATSFFNQCILPELVGKHYTTPFVETLSCKDSPIDNETDEKWCCCGGIEEGDMIFCEKLNCPIQWYHFECVGISHAPAGSWFCPECSVVNSTDISESF